jgi:hypothetical protein
MTIHHAVSGLLKKRAKFQAAYEYHNRHAAECQAALAALDATLVLNDAARNAPAILTQHYANPKLFRHGYIARLVVDVMREVQQPMTVGQICDVLIERHGLTIPIRDQRGGSINE